MADLDNNPNPPNNNFSHGTHVAGIVAAVNNNATGIASASNNAVKILPIKATSDFSSFNSIDNGYDGVAYAVMQGVDIISLSWGGGGFSYTEQGIMNYAYQNGILVVAAAGNDGNSNIQYPAAYEHVLAVASTTNTDAISSFSSYGTFVDIAAPGSGILSTIPTSAYASFSGTSMATPLVASVASYMKACFPNLSVDSLELILKKSADNIDAQNPSFIGLYGAGRLNMKNAVACIGISPLTLTTAASEEFLYICSGDTIQIGNDQTLGGVNDWYRNNGLVVSGVDTIDATIPGTYFLQNTRGNCVLKSSVIELNNNPNSTASPVVDDILYASVGDTVTINATINSCIQEVPKTYTYSGPTVGYDGGLKSGIDPSVVVNDFDGVIDSLTVSVTWTKMDQVDLNSCGLSDLGGSPWNDEVTFSLMSPEGKVIKLLAEMTYASGAATAGQIITTFTFNGTKIPFGSSPISGIYQAEGNLASLTNTLANGTWKLLAADNYGQDPLCVSGFEMTFTPKNINTAPEIRWETTSGMFISGVDSIVIPIDFNNDTSYFVSAKCPFKCQSQGQKVSIAVRSKPEILAWDINDLQIGPTQLAQIASCDSLIFENNAFQQTIVSGTDANSNYFSLLISSKPSLQSPVTRCNTDSLILFANACVNGQTWQNSATSNFIYLTSENSPHIATVTCDQTAMSSTGVQVLPANQQLQLTDIFYNYGQQNLQAQSINSSATIDVNSKVNYTATNNIELKPGFETNENVVFKAEIGNCPPD